MEFKLYKRRPISDDELIAEIKKVMNIIGKDILTMKDFDTYASVNCSTVIRRFGSWNKALQSVGAESGNHFHSEMEMMENIKDVWLQKGKQPAKRDMDNKALSHISSGAYLRKFGTWYNALEHFIEYITISEDTITTAPSASSGTFSHKTKRVPSNRMKVQVLMRDGNRCRICGVECSDGLHNIHFDHIIPWSKGGETTLDNLQVLCSACNKAKGNI